ncbi:MAG: tRNA-dihydrouridine synthase [Patescibacteria group bacterium]|nr:tRNA-dihydrouridine synthase [Patescibacteria group bacterium]
MTSIWQELKKPIICLAPMEGVTDMAFRQLLVNIGKPDLMFTEFVNVQSIFSHDQISYKQYLDYQNKEKPLIAQIWGLTPELFELSANLIADLGFNGVDINFGCPDKNVIKKGACSALINNRQLAGKIISATQAGAANKIPVSIKTRIGFNKIQTNDWLGFLLKFKPAVITIHGRTTKELSNVPNHWDEIGKAIKLRNQISPDTLIIGNGDIKSRSQALAKAKKYKLDGIMIGRGVFKDPFIFNKNKSIKNLSPKEKINLLTKHLEIFHKVWGDTKSIHFIKRFIKTYINGFNNALKIRTKIMETKTYSELKKTIQTYQ